MQVPTPTVWLSVAALALLCTAVTLLLFIWLIAHAGPMKTLTVTFLAPIFGIFWGALFLKEALTPGVFLGLVIILVGAGLVTELLLPGRPRRVAEVLLEPGKCDLIIPMKEHQVASKQSE
jgi:EamA domain-containing membrane protein RarD